MFASWHRLDLRRCPLGGRCRRQSDAAQI